MLHRLAPQFKVYFAHAVVEAFFNNENFLVFAAKRTQKSLCFLLTFVLVYGERKELDVARPPHEDFVTIARPFHLIGAAIDVRDQNAILVTGALHAVFKPVSEPIIIE
ncbi:MAG: hypothetical protein ACPGQV_16380 [Alphaproteobacteria bacterium]